MLPLETLHTIAEVGIAITGFAGIVTAIRGEAGRAIQASVTDPLSLLFGSSLGTVFFCFVPEWLDAALDSTEIVWQASLAAFGTYRIAYVALIVVSQRRAGIPDPVVWRARFGIGLGSLQLLGAAGFLSDYQYFLYLSGLFWGLVVALTSFYSLIRDPSAD